MDQYGQFNNGGGYGGFGGGYGGGEMAMPGSYGMDHNQAYEHLDTLANMYGGNKPLRSRGGSVWTRGVTSRGGGYMGRGGPGAGRGFGGPRGAGSLRARGGRSGRGGGNPNMNKPARKIFIGGLNRKTTDQTLNEHFSQFGELTDVIVMKDQVTQVSRGFGFVTYATDEQVDACQLARPHTIDGRTVETKRAIPIKDNPNITQTVTKLFVGGFKNELDEEDLRTYFGQYGNVIEVKIIVDKDTGKKKGFGFVEFDEYDPVDKIICKSLEQQHEIKERRVDVNKATKKDDLSGGPMDGGMGAGPMYASGMGTGFGSGYGQQAGGGAMRSGGNTAPVGARGGAGFRSAPYGAAGGNGVGRGIGSRGAPGGGRGGAPGGGFRGRGGSGPSGGFRGGRGGGFGGQ